MPYSHDTVTYETEFPNTFIPPPDESTGRYDPSSNARAARRMPQATEIEAGRTKLHRLLDEVLDKADTNEVYDPDSETERQKRRRQRRRVQGNMYDPRYPLIHNDNEQIRHTPIVAQVNERPDPAVLRARYNPYEAGDRTYDIERGLPVEFKPKYAADDNDVRSRYGPSSARSNPPLFYDDSAVPDRAMTAINLQGGPKRQGRGRIETDHEAIMRRNGQRLHKFDDDSVYIDTIPKGRDGSRAPVRNAWDEDDEHNEPQRYFHMDPSDLNPDPMRRNDYRDEYIMAKRSVATTKNLISSIHDELQNIVSDPSTDSYHA